MIEIQIHTSRIINEPWAGDVYNDLNLLLDQTGRADRKNLAPLYKQVYASIRSVNTNHMVFFGKFTNGGVGILTL